ncbi:MAG TPA: AAA family ATPase [Thermoplasmata archaeon]|nr:AAA family ATPase [Thermoplasmata archaeon]
MVRVAITGTPGTGKTTVSRRLPSRWQILEVADLARRYRATETRHDVELSRAGPATVDLGRLSRAVQSRPSPGTEVVVGHLAHLLPIRDVVVLRCHPRELARRLAGSRRTTPADLRENLLAEATDVVLVEAVERRRRIWEVDTTARAPASVAAEVARRIRTRGPASFGKVDWLGDRWVTAHLLDWSR